MHTRLLTQDELKTKGIIRTRPEPIPGTKKLGWRATSYDAQVGTIVTHDGAHPKRHYSLKPREIVWVISDENYSLPKNVTGLTTNKTTLTKRGILALTVGIVDPSYQGPLSTALINFSGSNFPIHEGMEFFRTAFFEHADTDEDPITYTDEEYLIDVISKNQRFSDTFLTMNTLADEIQNKIFSLPKLGVYFTIGALLISICGLLIGPLWGHFLPPQSNIELLERIEALERELSDMSGR